MTTILTDIKTALGVMPNNFGFDLELLLFINSSKAQLGQLGLEDFALLDITDGTEWPLFDNSAINDMVKHYMILRTKEAFDPIASETIAKMLSKSADILEGRITHEIYEVANVG